ncbi:MAG: TonB-dependent receptor plug domain-containing protein, partial [Akkermansiaceae bacterium]|nr:TonB-dependent receptor plug domain-containing protein [Akkermansiaceae bacterium]
MKTLSLISTHRSICKFAHTALFSTSLTAAISISIIQSSSAQSDGELSPLTVVGGKDRAFELVGSSAYLGKEDIEQQNYTNINRLLAKVPGVYTREEDGYGLFPNLSIRGNLGTRSEKTTIMEDGILMAP